MNNLMYFTFCSKYYVHKVVLAITVLMIAKLTMQYKQLKIATRSPRKRLLEKL